MMTEGLERVEVLKGASAFLNGAGPAGSVGGVINVIPKRAGSAPLTEFTPTYSTNSQFGGHIDFGRRFGDNEEYGVRINAVYRDGATPAICRPASRPASSPWAPTIAATASGHRSTSATSTSSCKRRAASRRSTSV